MNDSPNHQLPTEVLLVEDNFIIALDAKEMLHELGIPNVSTAASVAEALKLISEGPPQFAFLDVNLADEKTFAVAAHLVELGIPFAFATGYGDGRAFPQALTDRPVIAKPYLPENLQSVLLAHWPRTTKP